MAERVRGGEDQTGGCHTRWVGRDCLGVLPVGRRARGGLPVVRRVGCSEVTVGHPLVGTVVNHGYMNRTTCVCRECLLKKEAMSLHD